jgi:hypothetical protein
MATDLITQERLQSLLMYDPDTGEFRWRKTNKIAGTLHASGYWRVQIDGKPYLAHRLAWAYAHGAFPKNNIDHINHNRSDNRLKNLRLVTRSENQHNRKRATQSSSGFLGVSWFAPKKKWRAYIKANGTRHHLGWFSDLNAAVQARKAAERLYHPSRPCDATT